MQTSLEVIDGKKWMVKRAQSIEALPFLKSLFLNYQKLQAANLPFEVVTTRLGESDRVEFEYHGISSYELKLREAVKRGNKKTMLRLIEEYAALIRSLPSTRVEPPAAFSDIFGQALKIALPSCNCGCLDFNFDNILVDNDKHILIDFEWCFDFPIPTDYIIFRAITGFYGNNLCYRPGSVLSVNEALSAAFIAKELLPIFIKLERAFQSYVFGVVRDEEGEAREYEELDKPPIEIDFQKANSTIRTYAQSLEKEIAAKNSWISKLEGDLQKQNSWIEKIERDYAKLRASVIDQENKLSELQSKIEVSERSYGVVRGENVKRWESESRKKDEMIDTLEELLQEKARYLAEFKEDSLKMSGELRALRKIVSET